MRNIFLILFLLTAGVFSNRASAQAVILRSDIIEVPCMSPDTFLVPVYLDNLTNISGLQFTLQWDTARLDYAYVTMLHPQFMGAGFDTMPATLSLGKLTFAWTDVAGLSLPSNTVLFKVAFKRIGGPPASLSFVDDPTTIAVFDNQFNEVLFETENGLVKALDNAAPMITCPASVVTGGSGPTAIPNIAPVLADNCGTPGAGWSSVGATLANFPNDADASGALFNIGFSTVTYKATDAGGNTATCSFNILIEYSVTTTDLTLIANPNNLPSCGELVTIDVLAFNFDSIAGLQFSMDWLPAALQFVSITNTNTGLNITPINFNTDSIALGYFSFAWTSANLNGVSAPAGELLFTLNYTALGAGTVNFASLPTEALAFIGPSFDETTLITYGSTVSVVDNQPPTITCPADLTVLATGPTPVPGIAPVVMDNCSVAQVGWSVSGATSGNFPNDADASDALFNIGSNTVTYTTTDPGNNTASCSFNVTVEFGINTSDLAIIANNANAACSGGFGVDITALNFSTVAGIQFTIKWDASLYQYTSTSNFNLPIGINLSNFGVDSVGVGFITFAWTSSDPNGASVNDGDRLFTLNFDLLSNSPSSITFADLPTIRVAFDGGTFDEIPMMTFDGLVTVLDIVPPTIVCPPSITVDAPQGQLFATVNGLEPTTLTDNCVGLPDLAYSQTGATTNSGNGNANGNYNGGTTTVVYTALDGSGNSATCSFQVVVNADDPLILQLDTVDLGCQGAPTQITVNLTVENFNNIVGLQFGLAWDPLVLGLVLPVPINFITAGPPPLFINSANGTIAFFGGAPSWPNVPNGAAIMTLTFNVLDVNALATTNLSLTGPFDALDDNFDPVAVLPINGAFVFTLDNVPPVVACPSDTVVNALPLECSASYIPVAPAASDACGAIASVVLSPGTTIFNAGPPTTLTYTVSDDANNTTTCSFTVTVFENNPPQIVTCPVSPILVDANALCQANAFWTTPTFKDTCGQTASLIITNDFDSGGLFDLGTTTVSYTAKDLSGNQTTCSFDVVVRDVTPPTMTCPSDTVIMPINGCTSVVDFVTPVATDFCDMNVEILCSNPSGSVFSGVTQVGCTAMDDAGNISQCLFNITVVDALAPSFPDGCPANISLVSSSGNCGANPTWLAPLTLDNCDQNVKLVVTQASGTFFDVANSPHIVVYTASDAFGNTTTCSFSITVADSTKPVLSNCPSLPILVLLPAIKCDTILSWLPPTVSDNCGAGGLIITSNIAPGSLFTTGDTMVIYTVTDASGNSSTCAFNVSVIDVVKPIIDCPTAPLPVPVTNPCGVVPIWTLPTASDNCTPETSLIYSTNYLPGATFPSGITKFVIIVTDASGNVSLDCEIQVINNVFPHFTNVPGDITINTCQTMVTWAEPIPVDFCPPVTVTVSPLPSGSIFPFGTTTVTYTATDALGDAALATFNVTVSEDVAPVFNCPVSPIVVNVGAGIISDPSGFLISSDTITGCGGVELTFNAPNATDNCVTPTVTQLEGAVSGGTFPIGFNNLLFRAVDSSGNLTQCAVFIQVVELPQLDPVVDPSPGCEGEAVSITATSIPGATYTWTGPVTSATNVVNINSLSTQNDGPYSVTATVNGCSTAPDTAVVYLTLPPSAVNDLTYSINPGETITFPSVLTNDILSPAFDFGICDISVLEGLVMNDSDGTFTYTAGEIPGMVSFFYTVCSGTCDLSDQAAVTITINDTKCIFIPNIITPNNDALNDFLAIPCIDTGLFNENSIVVYSQWGDKVYQATPFSNDPAKAWYGTLEGQDGKDLPDGVYFYIFKPGPNIAPMKGFVEIFR
jgi:hypothetical protein